MPHKGHDETVTDFGSSIMGIILDLMQFDERIDTNGSALCRIPQKTVEHHNAEKTSDLIARCYLLAANGRLQHAR